MTWPTPNTRTSTLIGQKAVWLVSVCPWIVWFDWLQSFTPVEVDICMWGKGWNVHCPNSFPFLVSMTPAVHLVGYLWKCENARFRHFEIHSYILSYYMAKLATTLVLLTWKTRNDAVIAPCLYTTPSLWLFWCTTKNQIKLTTLHSVF